MTHSQPFAPSEGASDEGTTRYRGRFPALPSDHFRRALGLWLSSIGIGTYLGDHDRATDEAYIRAIARAVRAGCNVIDSAINYRFQRSERAIGEALADLIGRGVVRREELVICTKGGYLSFDGGPPRDARGWVEQTYVRPGLIRWDDIVSYNVMRPAYIRHELEKSLENLRLQTIDVYYLHNPEAQLEKLTRPEFLERIRACFEELERAVVEGEVRAYGTATWDGYRTAPEGPGYLSLEELVATARSVAGDGHHFKAIQLPFNLTMTEARTSRNQRVAHDRVTILEAARRLDVTVFASASLLQAQLARLPPALSARIPGLETDAQRALQVVRSAPGITTALVGMRTAAHVDENLGVATRDALRPEDYEALGMEAE